MQEKHRKAVGSLKTIERLQDRLDAQLAWRKKEIAALRNAATRAAVSREYYCRAGAVMLCAHWEGFLRIAVQSYVDHVFSQGLNIKKLKPQFVAIHFFKYVKTAGEANFPGSEQHHVKLAEKIIESFSGNCRKANWEAVTGGSPSSLVCSQLLSSIAIDPRIGYDEQKWSVAKVFIDSQILKDRHKIAHGERFPVDHEDFLSRSGRVIDMCEDLARLIVSSATSRAYAIADVGG